MTYTSPASLPAPHMARIAHCFALILVCLSLALFAGCGKKPVTGTMPTSPPTDGTYTPGTTKPYTVMGQTYYPLASGHGYVEEGVASWYGKDFHGKTTSNGEVYDMHGMTCAHKILPFGTQLRVTNLDNNKSIVVRVNDRGPFVANRIIDLTKTGAEQIDMIGPGTARVRLESIGTVPGQVGADLTGNFYVQIGSFSMKDNAHNLAKTLQNKGKASRVVYVPELNFHRVQIGPYSSLAAAENASVSLQGEYPGNFVVAQ
ncbi:RlpA-like lipoprotein [uncultured delta proteobacterium]|uniref:Probable endolytic peptidoglycan transglycosylase RlpA n=1 Tax=uncultured delta proteobacterium TaxID=34034 RepID=A0A212JVK8_9DELT|nr:RlpA-like lipoprotein [uncultured delta proteobacterium]